MSAKFPRVWFAAFFLLNLFCGVAAGMVIARTFERAAPSPSSEEFLGSFVRLEPAALAKLMARDVGLTSAQQQQLEQLFERRRGRAEDFHAQVRARFEREQRELHGEIQEILTPEQFATFEARVRQTSRGLGRSSQRSHAFRELTISQKLFKGLQLGDEQRSALEQLCDKQWETVEPQIRELMQVQQQLQVETYADAPDPRRIEELQRRFETAHATALAGRVDLERRVSALLTSEQRDQMRERLNRGGPPGGLTLERGRFGGSSERRLK